MECAQTFRQNGVLDREMVTRVNQGAERRFHRGTDQQDLARQDWEQAERERLEQEQALAERERQRLEIEENERQA
jgi:hypothetical protein